MKAMIFAAGLGTRLKPLTDTLPKALVPVAGRTLLEHVCRKLMCSGISEAVINVHHFADRMESWISSQDWISLSREEQQGKMLVHISDERAMLLETGGAVLHARRFLEGCGSFLVHNVDILSDCDISWLRVQVRPDALATLLVSNRRTSRFFLFAPDSMRLAGWKNVVTGDVIMSDPSLDPDDCLAYGFSGIHILSDSVFGLMDEYLRETGLPAGAKFSIKEFYLWAAARKPIYAAVGEGLRLLDVGKLDALQPAEEFVKSIKY